MYWTISEYMTSQCVNILRNAGWLTTSTGGVAGWTTASGVYWATPVCLYINVYTCICIDEHVSDCKYLSTHYGEVFSYARGTNIHSEGMRTTFKFHGIHDDFRLA